MWAPSPDRELPHFPARRFEGRDAIAGAFRAHTHAPEVFHLHLVFEPHVRLDGDRAVVSSGFARVDEGAAGPTLRSFGRYDDVLVRCDDGRWRFELREASIRCSVVPPGS